MKISLNNKVTQIILLIFLAVVWGSSFLLMKKGLVAFSASELAATRIVIAFIVLFPFAIKNLKLLYNKHGKWILLTALTGNGIPAFLFAIAQTKIDSSLSGMLNSLTPLFTLLIAIMFFKAKAGWNKIAGVIVGLVGTAGLVYFSSKSGLSYNNSLYSLYVVAATVCYGISVNILKEKLYEIKSEVITSLAFVIIAPFCLIYLLFATPIVETLSSENGLLSLFYIALLAIIGTALAVILFNQLIKHTSSVFASSVTYLIPVVAVFWGVLDGESISSMQIALFLLILSGVALVMSNK